MDASNQWQIHIMQKDAQGSAFVQVTKVITWHFCMDTSQKKWRAIQMVVKIMEISKVIMSYWTMMWNVQGQLQNEDSKLSVCALFL